MAHQEAVPGTGQGQEVRGTLPEALAEPSILVRTRLHDAVREPVRDEVGATGEGRAR